MSEESEQLATFAQLYLSELKIAGERPDGKKSQRVLVRVEISG